MGFLVEISIYRITKKIHMDIYNKSYDLFNIWFKSREEGVVIMEIFKNITLNSIIIFLLGVLSIRDIIAKNFAIPKNKKWSFLFYNKSDIDKIPLCYKRYELSIKKQSISYRKMIENLLFLASCHAKKFNNGLVHGRFKKGMIQSKYFINTLEASYNDNDLKIMKAAITKLVQNEENVWDIDFVLGMKIGNSILSNSFAQDFDAIGVCFISLDKATQAVTLNEDNDKVDSLSLVFENIDKIIEIANSKTKPLNGIVVDCSVSSGEGLKQCVMQFNKLIDEGTLGNVRKIEHAFVLYSHQNSDLDQRLENVCKVHRFFDMDEDIRAGIYEKIANTENKSDGVKLIYKELKNKGLIRCDI